MPKPKFKGKRTKAKCRSYVSKRIKHHVGKGKGQKQSIAIAFSEARSEKCRFKKPRESDEQGSYRIYGKEYPVDDQ